MKVDKKEFVLPGLYRGGETLCETKRYEWADKAEHPLSVLSFGHSYSLELYPRDVEVLAEILNELNEKNKKHRY